MATLIEPREEGVPAELASKKQWLVWKANKRVRTDGTVKVDKVPYGAKKGEKGGIERPDLWVDFQTAYTTFLFNGDYSGIGFAFTRSDPFFAVDLDNCFEVDGTLKPYAELVVNTLKTYTERSVSGKGLHIIGKGHLPGPGRVDHGLGLEVYEDGRYFTITGDVYEGHGKVHDRKKEIDAVYNEFFGEKAFKHFTIEDYDHDPKAKIMPVDDFPITAEIKELIKEGTGSERYNDDRSEILFFVACDLVRAGVNKESIISAFTDSRNWLGRAAMERRGQNSLSATEWLWKYTLGKIFARHEEEKKLEAELEADTTFSPTVRNIRQHIREVGKTIDWDKTNHERNAKNFRSKCAPTIRVNKQWLVYTGKCWSAVNDELLMSYVSLAMSGNAFRMSLVNNTYEQVKRDSCVQTWEKAPNKLVFKNGVIDIDGWNTCSMNMTLLPHSKEHRVVGYLDYNYDPSADCPVFHRWLKDVTQGDKDLMLLIQQVMGYCLTDGNVLQRYIHAAGASGTGKSTFANLMVALVGRENVAVTNLSSLAGNHGTAILENKKLVLLPDAKQSSGGNFNKSNEVLLNIAGGDPLHINPKGKDEHVIYDPPKAFLTTNELPRFTDSFGALQRRVLLIPFNHRVKGREIRDILEQMKAELPGIFNWALEGLKHLGQNMTFVEPSVTNDLKEEFSQLLNPVNYFTSHFIDHTGDQLDRVSKSELYDAYQMMCMHDDLKPYTKNQFGRSLKAQEPDLKEGRLTGESRDKCYIGLKLKKVELNNYCND